MTPNYAQKYDDPLWQTRSTHILKRDPRCILCGAPASDTHHLRYRGENPWDALDGDLIGLCHHCHFDDLSRDEKLKTTLNARRDELQASLALVLGQLGAMHYTANLDARRKAERQRFEEAQRKLFEQAENQKMAAARKLNENLVQKLENESDAEFFIRHQSNRLEEAKGFIERLCQIRRHPDQSSDQISHLESSLKTAVEDCLVTIYRLDHLKDPPDALPIPIPETPTHPKTSE